MSTKINRIVLQGFKSFNRKVSIPFIQGFNIIIGPNGCGKSNLLDAICFAFGTMSAKSLRAGKLNELIFYGSEKAKPAKQASVTVYLDNSKKFFPFEESEISITRKINNAGICAYKLNGKTVTRDKILQVLSSNRIYPDGHNIIFQGDVTQIIEMSPIERRKIIDEISGIEEYNERKEKALRNLQFVEEKLKEAEILIKERYNIFKKLEKERNAALLYQELTKKLKILKASYANKKFEILKKRLEKIQQQILKKKEEIESLNEKLKNVEKEFEKRSEEIRNVAMKLIAFSKRVESEKEASKLRTEILLKKGFLEAKEWEIERLNFIIEKFQALERKEEFEIPRAVKEILNQNFKGVYGTISSLIEIPESLRIAIQTAAGAHLYDIVVENEDVAKFCIEFLKREKIGRACFLPLNKIKPSIVDDSILNKEGVIGIASKLIKTNQKFAKAIEFVFGTTIIVKDLESAKNIGIGKVRMVTLDGDLIEKSGLMIGGYYISPLTIKKSKKELDACIQKRKELREEIALLKREIEELENELKKFVEKEPTTIEIEKIKVSSQIELEELREKRRKFYEKRLSLQSILNDLEIESVKIEAEMSSAKIEAEQYGKIEYLDKKPEEILRSIKKVEKEIEKIGPINFKAIEEYEIFKKEFDKYKAKYEKILEEKNAILRMIEEIEQKRKEVFFSCLEKLANSFNSVFNKITGGTAELELEDRNNLESGLIIRASPMGKNLLNIDAMSGGEKTLTALGFLFAIQKLKPAPFYILDEIDAALDKENTKKIAEMIKELSNQNQFIVITHNDQTVKYGDIVYGVTMVDGESKIVGIEMPKT